MSWKACVATSSGPTAFGPMLYAGRVRECVQVSRELGFEGIEVSMRSTAELDRRELEGWLSAAGLRLAAVASGRAFLQDGLCLASPDQSVRAGAVTRVSELAAFAAAFDAPVIVGLLRGKTAEPGDLERFVGGMRDCADEAARHGGRLVVEAINRYETALLTTAAETVTAVRRIDRPNVQVLLDSFHMNIEEVSLGDAIRATGRHLGHFHIADSNRRAAGMGHLDFGEVAAALRDIGYRGWLSAEILPLPDDKAAAEQARRSAAAISDTTSPRDTGGKQSHG
jgi:5-keto-L-gluconate epimerase